MSESHKAASATSDVMSNFKLLVKLATLEYEMPQQSQPPTSALSESRKTRTSNFKLEVQSCRGPPTGRFSTAEEHWQDHLKSSRI
jgi:hypothetical protein